MKIKRGFGIKGKILLMGILFLLIISLGLVAAEGNSTNETLQSELNNLTSYLSSQNYDWLINYSANNLINKDNLMLSIDNKMLTL